MKRLLKNAVGLSLVSVAGTSIAGAWSGPWESSNAKKDDDLKILYFQGVMHLGFTEKPIITLNRVKGCVFNFCIRKGRFYPPLYYSKLILSFN